MRRRLRQVMSPNAVDNTPSVVHRFLHWCDGVGVGPVRNLPEPALGGHSRRVSIRLRPLRRLGRGQRARRADHGRPQRRAVVPGFAESVGRVLANDASPPRRCAALFRLAARGRASAGRPHRGAQRTANGRAAATCTPRRRGAATGRGSGCAGNRFRRSGVRRAGAPRPAHRRVALRLGPPRLGAVWTRSRRRAYGRGCDRGMGQGRSSPARSDQPAGGRTAAGVARSWAGAIRRARRRASGRSHGGVVGRWAGRIDAAVLEPAWTCARSAMCGESSTGGPRWRCILTPFVTPLRLISWTAEPI